MISRTEVIHKFGLGVECLFVARLLDKILFFLWQKKKVLAKDYKAFLICFREYIMTDNLSQVQLLLSSLSFMSNFVSP